MKIKQPVCFSVLLMKLEILEKSDRRMKFVLEDTDAAFANALRRAMRSEVPIMAIETVDLEENSSGMFDEMLAHRLGLIPLVFPVDEFRLREGCSCRGRGCSRCEIHFALEKQGPCVVYAKDMKSTHEDVYPLDKDIPITELFEGQRLKFTAATQLGFGKDHAKWQAAHAGYQNVPSVKVNAEKADTKVVDVCPTHVFEKRDSRVRVADEMKCILCMRCVEISDGVKIAAREDAFLFDVESVSGLAVGDIVAASLDALKARTEAFVKDFKKEMK